MDKVALTTFLSGLSAGLAAFFGASLIVVAIAGAVGAVLGAVIVEANKESDGRLYGFFVFCVVTGFKAGLMSGLLLAVGTVLLFAFDAANEQVVSRYLQGTLLLIAQAILLVIFVALFFYCLKLVLRLFGENMD